MSKNSLVESTKESLEIKNIKDLAIDYLEIGVDELVNNEIIQKIPVLKTISSFIGIGLCLQERNFLKQTQMFLLGYNVDSKLKDKYIKRIDNSKELDKEIERILLVLNSTIESSQSYRLGMFYKAYSYEQIDKSTFNQLFIANQNVYEDDLNLLQSLKENKQLHSKEIKPEDLSIIERLNSTGLIIKNVVQEELRFGKIEFNTYVYRLSKLGNIYLFYSDKSNFDRNV